MRHASVDVLCDVLVLPMLIWRLEHGQKLYKCQEKPSGVYKMQETLGGRGSAQDPAEGAYSASTDP